MSDFLKYSYLAAAFLLIGHLCYGQKKGSQQQEPLLDRKLTLSISKAETLESVIFRLENLTSERFFFRPNLFYKYKAKVASYKDAAFSDILEEQLTGTTINYTFDSKSRHLVFTQKEEQ